MPNVAVGGVCQFQFAIVYVGIASLCNGTTLFSCRMGEHIMAAHETYEVEKWPTIVYTHDVIVECGRECFLV